jgi:ABC-type sugar transport system permease subunit
MPEMKSNPVVYGNRFSRFTNKYFPYIAILPALLVIILFTVYPVLYAIRISVYQNLLTRPGINPFVGFQNFTNVINSYYFKTSMINTGTYTLFTVIGVMAFGMIVGLLMNTKLITTNALKIIILLPWAIPAVVAGLMWKWILNTDFGILNSILYSLGLVEYYIPFLSDPTLAKLSLILAHIWKEGPLAAIFILSGLQLIPDELYDSARIDGGNALKVYWYVTLPLLRPILLVVLVYETMISILTFDIVFVMTGGGPANATSLISWFAYAEIFRKLNLGHGIALSIILALITLILIIIYLRLIRTQESIV